MTKADIFNWALQALLLNRQISNPDSDKSNEAKALLTNWDVALKSALADMNLTSTATRANLELVAQDPIHHWHYAYKYPSNCSLFRRIIGCAEVDDKRSHIPKLIGLYQRKKVIFARHHHTDIANASPELKAVGEYIQTDFPIQTLQADAGICIAHKLALLSASLITGKGASTLMKRIEANYSVHKALAQAVDSQESFSFQSEETMSEFVETRMS